jgi:hypothetical protein
MVSTITGTCTNMMAPGPMGPDDNMFTRSTVAGLRLGYNDSWLGKADQDQKYEQAVTTGQ